MADWNNRLRSLVLLVFAWAICSQAPPHAAQTSATPTVKVSIGVTDASGRMVTDLKPEDLQLFDDGNPEAIAYFSKDAPPVTYGLVFDCSSSVKPHFPALLEAAKQVIASNRVDDETFIISFVSSDKIDTVQEPTSDKATLVLGLNKLRLEMGQTAVIDAVYLAVQHAVKQGRAQDNRRHLIVLFSDGEDRASYYRQEQLFELLRKSDVEVFVIALVSALDDDRGLVRKSPRQKATELVLRLAKDTGGQAFVLTSPKQLAEATSSLTDQLRNQYVLGYNPTRDTDKLKRKVEVKLVKSPEREKWRVKVGRITVNKAGQP